MGASESRWDRFRFGLPFQKGIPLVETQPREQPYGMVPVLRLSIRIAGES